MTYEHKSKPSDWLKCHECGQQVDECVELGEEPDYESCTASVCLPCLRQAVALCERKGACA